MARTGYGAEIARIINKMPYNTLIQTDEIANRLASRFSIPGDKAKAAVNVKLKRMCDHGDIRRLRKGEYCRVRQTVFGPILPDIDQLMAARMTLKNGVRIGYESGASLFNRIGLTTLLPRVVEITTNDYGARLPEGCRIRLKKPAAKITDDNWKYLQFIDAVRQIHDISVDAEDSKHILRTLARKQELDPLTLIFTARRYDSVKTLLSLTDLFMEGKDAAASE